MTGHRKGPVSRAFPNETNLALISKDDSRGRDI